MVRMASHNITTFCTYDKMTDIFADVDLNWLTLLTKSPDWEVREAATAIVFHRFAANAECMADLRSKLKDKKGDAEEKTQLETLRDMAHAKFDLYIPISRSPQLLDTGRARRVGTDLMASPVTFEDATQSLEDAAQSARRTLELVGQIANGLQFTSADASPVFSPDQAATFDSGGLHEEAEQLDTPNADDSMALLGELPMDERDTEESHQRPFGDEMQRRRQRREAIAIGNLEDGLEIYEPGSEGDVHERTANELIESMRGLGGQVQGLLDTLEQIQPRP